jgi:hypothetical protein
VNTKFWIRALYAEGFLISGAGLGWGIGFWSKGMGMLPYALFGTGMASLMAALALKRMSETRAPEDKYLRAVDLQDSFKASRVYGAQPPVFDDERVRTEAIAIAGQQLVMVPHRHEVLLELWNGPELYVYSGSKRHVLAPQQILRLEDVEKGALQIGQVSTELEYGKPIDSHLLLHFISPD